MQTPICDFARAYAETASLRAHMPGHKGRGVLGVEALDLTEIPGADSLYEADGIIAQSEKNATELFGCPTYYSTEGSSQCIRAMVHLAMLYAGSQGRKPLICAGRNAHRSFLSAVALLDVPVRWIYPEYETGYLSCPLTESQLRQILEEENPSAVYLTTPDYLGNLLNLEWVARVCHQYGALLLVDNAHGAYLKFLPQSRHPIDLGADICCDSAHKTLSVLTGGAYLHLSEQMQSRIAGQVKAALALFGSTSPSYLILQSLDAANASLADDYPQKLAQFAAQLSQVKKRLMEKGFELCGDEPLKLTLRTKSWGYPGTEFAEQLSQCGVQCEFADPDYVVLMLTPENGADAPERVLRAVLSVVRRVPVLQQPPRVYRPECAMDVRQAVLAPQQRLPVEQCLGRILAAATVACPPAVPIAVCGERLDEKILERFVYYGISSCTVVAQQM